MRSVHSMRACRACALQEGLEAGGFAPAMAALIAQLKAWRPSLLVTISPYDDVWRHYRELLRVRGPGEAAAVARGRGLRQPEKHGPFVTHGCADTHPLLGLVVWQVESARWCHERQLAALSGLRCRVAMSLACCIPPASRSWQGLA